MVTEVKRGARGSKHELPGKPVLGLLGEDLYMGIVKEESMWL